MSSDSAKYIKTDYLIAYPESISADELSLLGTETNSVLYINQDGKDYSFYSDLFKNWPKHLPIITNAENHGFKSLLLLASLFDRSIHISGVKKPEDLFLIKLSKERGLNVTCDVSVFDLFPLPSPALDSCSSQSEIDRFKLWDNLDLIDCFSVGRIPNIFDKPISEDSSIQLSYLLALPLLLTAVGSTRLTIQDILTKFSVNPRRILGLSEHPETFIELHVNRTMLLSQNANEISAEVASKINEYYGAKSGNAVHRVVYSGTTVYLDGKQANKNSQILGHDLSRKLFSTSSGPSKKEIITQTPRISDIAAEHAPIASANRRMSTDLPIPRLNLSEKAQGLAEPSSAFDVPADIRLSSNNARLEIDAQFPSIQSSYGLSAGYVDEARNSFLPSILERFGGANPFYGQSVISVKQLSKSHLYLLFAVASELRTVVERFGMIPILTGKVMASVFYEPSSRTSASFQTAMMRLGGQVFSIDSKSSSVTKGETLSDTIRAFSSYSDCVVLRHPDVGAAKSVAKLSHVPILNAGDGAGEHPTQAMLDAFTIREELGTVNGLVITMVGDLKNGRTVHSLAKILCLFNNITINYIAPNEDLQMPDHLIDEINALAGSRNIRQFKHFSLNPNILAITDVLYVTRIQKERFSSLEEYDRIASSSFVIDNSVLKICKKKMIVMHPLPRLDELSVEIDTDNRSAYFRQMRYGMFVRMALLSLIMTSENH
jgi:carbamoyl-phosphate synthase/aspartate carbamoyltransferase